MREDIPKRCWSLLPSRRSSARGDLRYWRLASLLVLALGVAVCPHGAVFGQNASLPPAWQQKSFAQSFTRKRTIPKLDKGYLISFRRRVLTSYPADAIYLHALDSGAAQSVRIDTGGAPVVWIEDASLTASHDLIVGGSTEQAVGGGLSNFIEVMDLQGNQIRRIDTGAFSPAQVCGTSDGSIWTLGQDWQQAASRGNYAMLRKYTASGSLAGSYLQRKDLPVRFLNLSARQHYIGGQPGRYFLTCGTNYVGAYIGPARQWVQVGVKSGQEKRWQVTPPAMISLITGLTTLNDTEVYGTFLTAGAHYVNQQRGLYRLSFATGSTAKWVPVAGQVSAFGVKGPIRRLLGSDKSSLVYTQNRENEKDGTPLLSWSKP